MLSFYSFSQKVSYQSLEKDMETRAKMIVALSAELISNDCHVLPRHREESRIDTKSFTIFNSCLLESLQICIIGT